MAENFDLIFGQSASSQYEWNDSDYQNGWGTVGSTPPTAEQFDALQRRSDTKAQELNNALTPLVAQNTANNRQPLTAYALKDIRYSSLLPTGWYLECTTAGTSASGDITLPTPLVENATVTDGTVTWKVRKISSADGMPIGAIIAFGGNGAIPSGYLLCDGAAYSRTALPDLFACIGTDYGSGDGSTTFNVPDSNQAKRFLQGDTVAGQTKSAGLPNITGTFAVRSNAANYGAIEGASGAFGSSNQQNIMSGGVSSGVVNNAVLTIDASRSSSIYGNSTTVQPDALTTRYIIKAFDGQTADSALIDITQYANELGNKADRSLSNLTNAGKSFSFPSDTYVNIASYINTEYTAPTDGYVLVNGYGTTTNDAMIRIMVNNTAVSYDVTNGTTTSHVSRVEVKKGDVVKATISSNVRLDAYQFYYAQGEVPA